MLLQAPPATNIGDAGATQSSGSAPDATTVAVVTPTPAPYMSAKVKLYAKKIVQYNRHIDYGLAKNIAYAVLVKSQRYGTDPRLVFALLAQESRFNPHAVSPVGARGLGQLMPGTASRLGVADAFDINENIDGTVRYLAQQLQHFNGNVSYALAAYNAGPGNVNRYGGIPPFHETQNYVRTISTHYNLLVTYNL
jgi:soluble lytic murein transglycosylase-like protein